jgi:hypothetical protein
MVVTVLIGQGISIFPVNIHEDWFKNNSSMGMIVSFDNILPASNLNDLFPFSEVMPFVLKQILQSLSVESDSLIVDIFVVDVSRSWSPCAYLWNSDWYCWDSVRHCAEFATLHLVVLSEQNWFMRVKQSWNQTSQMRVTCQNGFAMGGVFSSNDPTIGTRSFNCKLKGREINRPQTDISLSPILLEHFSLMFKVILLVPAHLLQLLIR